MLSCLYSLNSEKSESPVTPNISRTSSAVAVPSLAPAGVDEKRMRREIANSNERRRMQSINAGFQSLRSLLPHHEGEKLSKVNTRLFAYFSSIRCERHLRVCCWTISDDNSEVIRIQWTWGPLPESRWPTEKESRTEYQCDNQGPTRYLYRGVGLVGSDTYQNTEKFLRSYYVSVSCEAKPPSPALFASYTDTVPR